MKEDLGQNPVLTLLVKSSAGTHDINLLYIMQSQYHCLGGLLVFATMGNYHWLTASKYPLQK